MAQGASRRPVPLRKALEGTIRALGIEGPMRRAAIPALWVKVVEPEVAACSRAESLKEGRLFVRVADSATLQHLSFVRHRLTEVLNRQLGAKLVREIYLTIGVVPPPPPEAPERPTPPPRSLSHEEEAWVETTASPLHNHPAEPVVRRILRRILVEPR